MIRNHILGHSGALPPPNAIDRLLECNEPPSEEERAEILSRLQHFEHGRSVSRNARRYHLKADPNETRSLQADSTYMSIVSALSFVRCIPIEIWQRVFEFVVFDPTMKDCDPLRMLTRVSRRWNGAASTHQILWSILPPVSLLNTAGPITPSQHSAICSRLQLFLSRSGSKHIDFQCFYSSSEDVWRTNQTVMLDILSMFVEVSSRWRDAVLHFPANIAEQALAPLRAHGRLPHLEKLQLELNVWGLDRKGLQQHARKVRVDHFNNAPNLRHVTVNTFVISVPVFPVQILDENNTFLDLHLPWSQIETYHTRITTTGRDMGLCRVIPEPGSETDGDTHETRPRLREVVYDARNGHLPIPNKGYSITLSNLVKLCLRMGNTYPGDMIARHLSRLILPSLSELEVRNGNFVTRPDDDTHWPTLYDQVITLIRQSGCSDTLLRLRLDEKTGPRSANQLQELYLLCPNLEYLDVRVLREQELRVLRLNNNHPKLLPNLKVLCLRWPSERTYHESRIISIRGRKPPILTPSTLWDVVQSRALPPARLEEVQLLGASSSEEEHGVMDAQMNLLIGDDAWPFPTGSWASNAFDYEEILQLRTELQKKFKPIRGRYPTGAYVNFMLHREMDGIMRKLEELDLDGCEGVILARVGILYHLDEIARTEEGVIPGDWMYTFRSRAASLLAMWKPIILPQFQALSHQWCYVPLGSARLRCQRRNGERNTATFGLKTTAENHLGRSSVEGCNWICY